MNYSEVVHGDEGTCATVWPIGVFVIVTVELYGISTHTILVSTVGLVFSWSLLTVRKYRILAALSIKKQKKKTHS